jgi:hypothetical protein
LKGVIEKMRNAQCPKDKVFRLRCGSDGSYLLWRDKHGDPSILPFL